jgi:hypothetical protein
VGPSRRDLPCCCVRRKLAVIPIGHLEPQQPLLNQLPAVLSDEPKLVSALDSCWLGAPPERLRARLHERRRHRRLVPSQAEHYSPPVDLIRVQNTRRQMEFTDEWSRAGLRPYECLRVGVGVGISGKDEGDKVSASKRVHIIGGVLKPDQRACIVQGPDQLSRNFSECPSRRLDGWVA